MKIGSLDIGNKLLVAPMADISDAAFRKISKKHGAGLTFTQMVSAEGVVKNNFETLRLSSFGRDEKPIGVQLLGKDPAIIGEAVSELRKVKPDLIDLNCGCPIEKVTSKGMGASLSDDPQLLGRIVKSMVAAAAGEIPISVKLRLGKDHSNINISDTIKVVEDNGASLVIVHARTSADSYQTDSSWNWLKKIKDSVSIPLVGNGSCFSPTDAKELLDSTNCDSVMIARGALGNPFYFSRFNSIIENGIDPGEPEIDEVVKVILEHINLLVKEFGEISAFEKVKKQTVWYLKNYPGIISFLDNIFKVKSIAELKELILSHEKNIKSGILKNENIFDINSRFKNKVLFWLSE
jgi:tRNA-dihydrouridine synthase B